MKRLTKNIINIIVIIAMVAANALTVYYVNKQLSAQSPNVQLSENADIQNKDSDIPGEIPENDNDSTSDEENSQQSEQSENTDLSVNSKQNGNSQNPPEKPSQESINSENDEESSETNQNDMQPPSDSNMQMPDNSAKSKVNILYYVLFGIENFVFSAAVMYLIMSKANKKSVKETFKNSDKIIIYILSVIIIISALTTADGFILSKTATGNSQNSPMQMSGESASGADASGKTEVTDKQELNGKFSSQDADENAILVKDGGELTLSNSEIIKNGDSTNTENSEFYGINSGILVTEGSKASISGANITTDSKGSNAVFATGEDAKIYISDSTITTTGESSARGLDATYGGYIEADNVTITTQGTSCAALATDRGEGTVIVKKSKLETNKAGSPVIYSTGEISVSETSGTANGSQMVVVEGKNSACVENSELSCSGAGNRNNADNAGIMIYQSMSGDASVGTGNFSSTNSSLSINKNSDYYKTAPMFFVTNTDAVINLENTTLSFGSNVLLSAKGTDEWGTKNSNGGNVIFNAEKQKLNGNIELDSISELQLKLSSSSYEGAINSDNSAKSVALTLDKDSSITLTGDSYVTSLENEDSSNSNIKFNGYKLYVNGKAVN